MPKHFLVETKDGKGSYDSTKLNRYGYGDGGNGYGGKGYGGSGYGGNGDGGYGDGGYAPPAKSYAEPSYKTTVTTAGPTSTTTECTPGTKEVQRPITMAVDITT